jgi:hypothetical protein
MTKENEPEAEQNHLEVIQLDSMAQWFRFAFTLIFVQPIDLKVASSNLVGAKFFFIFFCTEMAQASTSSTGPPTGNDSGRPKTVLELSEIQFFFIREMCSLWS